MSDEQEHRSTLVQRLRDYGVYRDVAPSSLDLMEEAADRIVALEAERDRLAADNQALREKLRDANWMPPIDPVDFYLRAAGSTDSSPPNPKIRYHTPRSTDSSTP